MVHRRVCDALRGKPLNPKGQTGAQDEARQERQRIPAPGHKRDLHCHFPVSR